MQYLDAVNLLLKKVGTRAVSSVDVNHPDVVDAKSTIDLAVSAVLDRGWWFNKRETVTHTPNTEGYINLGIQTLRIEPDNATRRIYPILSLRGSRVYDVQNNTFVFHQTITVDEYIKLEWEELPATARMYIAYKAAAEFVSDKLEDTPKSNSLERVAQGHLEDLHGDELRATKPNMLNTPQARSIKYGVNPYGGW